MKNIDFTPIQSSMVNGAHHDGSDLYVKFSNGSVYRYANVPEDVFMALLEAPSAGKFVRSQLVNSYEAVKIEG